MIVTFILSLILMAALFLGLWVAVALVQSKKLFTTAPKDIQAAALEHKERFPGTRALGWLLLLLCVLLFLGVFIYAGWDGIQRGYSFWQFAGRFLTILYLEKTFDIIVLDTRRYRRRQICQSRHQNFKKKPCLLFIGGKKFLSPSIRVELTSA